jgi:hypothetical protein
VRLRSFAKVVCPLAWLLACATETEDPFAVPPPTAIGGVRDAGIPPATDASDPFNEVSDVCKLAPKPDVIAQLGDPTELALALHGGEVYVMSDVDIRAYNLDTKAERLVYLFPQIHNANQMVVDASGVYFLGNKVIVRLPLTGGTPETMYTGTVTRLVESDATHLYAITSPLTRIEKLTKKAEDLGSPRVAGTLLGSPKIRGGYFFGQQTDETRKLYRLQLTPPLETPTLIAEEQCAFEMNDDTIYCPTSDRVARFTLDGVALADMDLPAIDQRELEYYPVHATAESILLKALPPPMNMRARFGKERFFVARNVKTGLGTMVGCSVEATVSNGPAVADGHTVAWVSDKGQLLSLSY